MSQLSLKQKYLGLNLSSYLIAASRLRVLFGKMEATHISEGGCEDYRNHCMCLINDSYYYYQW